MRPSTPMSPTCTLFGMPPRAMRAQFSNSNGGMARNFSSLHGKSRTTKPRPAFQSGSLSGSAQTFCHDAAGGGRNINANPLAFQILRGDERRAATAERIQHDVVWITAALDNTL